MANLSLLTGTPWHVEKWHLAEGDTRRHCARCIYYEKQNEKFCSRIGRKCFGSAHCEYYSEEAHQDIAVKPFSSSLTPLGTSKNDIANTAKAKDESKSESENVNLAKGYSNFAFIGSVNSEIEQVARDAEYYLGSDANVAIYKIGRLGELIVNSVFDKENISYLKSEKQVDSINALYNRNLLPKEIVASLTKIRIGRNKAVHENYDSEKSARTLLKNAYVICCWFMKQYGSSLFDPTKMTYIEPFYEGEKFEKAASYILPPAVKEEIKKDSTVIENKTKVNDAKDNEETAPSG